MLMAASEEANSFRDQQLRYPRVRAAAKEKDHALRRRCEEKKISYPPRAILFRAFKREAPGALGAAQYRRFLHSHRHLRDLCYFRSAWAQAKIRRRAGARGILRTRLVQSTEQFFSELAHQLPE